MTVIEWKKMFIIVNIYMFLIEKECRKKWEKSYLTIYRARLQIYCLM